MTETPAGSDAGTEPPGGGTATATAPPPPLFPPSVPLVRPAHDRVFRGVAAAVGRATGTDPVLWRVLFVVLAVFGGSGIVLYLAGWLLIPEEGRATSHAQDVLGGRGGSTTAKVLLTVLGVVAVLVVLDDGRGVVPLLVVGGLAWLVWRNRTTTAGPAGPAVPTGAAAWTAPPAWTAPTEGDGAPPSWVAPPVSYGPPPPPPPPRPRSNLGSLTLSATVLVVGALLLARTLGAEGITAGRVLASALLVVGLGLLAGAWWGRARWLVLLAVPLALATAATASVDDRFGGETGERTWVVSGSAEHRLGAGTAVLDLRPLAGTERRVTVDGRIGAGELTVLVPEDTRVQLDAEVGLGALRVVDADGVERETEGGGLDREEELGPEGRRTVVLDVQVGVGELEVRVVPAG